MIHLGGDTAELLRALGGSAAVLGSAVSGLGGIGKTALAVETAHPACGEGWFPGGCSLPERTGQG